MRYVILHVYLQALLRWGLWEEVISDHGGQFRSIDWMRVNKRHGRRPDGCNAYKGERGREH
ncbi:MAG TPA: hypothetical protein VJ810_37705 [Blastocatellia bacterium]|nr:hypothetical protein [Blastocatellia bacterium]